MKNQCKRALILALTGVLIATAPTVSVSAASKKTKNVIKNTEKIIEITTEDSTKTIETNNTKENTKTDDIKESDENTKVNSTKEDEKLDATKESKEDIKTDNTKESKEDTKTDDTKESKEDAKIDDTKESKENTETNDAKKEEKIINYTTKILTITKSGFVADSLNGVDALYRTGRNDGSNSTYSCAAFIKRYYKEVHGVTVMNLFAGRTPSSSKGRFNSVSTPQVGDVVACPSTSGSNHWAIVKQVNDNNTVTLIEQNWKWTQGGQTLCKINRSISISIGKFYRLYK